MFLFNLTQMNYTHTLHTAASFLGFIHMTRNSNEKLGFNYYPVHLI